MSDGTLSVRRRQPKASQQSDPLTTLKGSTFESYLNANLTNIGMGKFKDKSAGKARPVGDVDELKIESKRKKKLREYDRLLKAFKYAAALDSVLRKVRVLCTALPSCYFVWHNVHEKFHGILTR